MLKVSVDMFRHHLATFLLISASSPALKKKNHQNPLNHLWNNGRVQSFPTVKHRKGPLLLVRWCSVVQKALNKVSIIVLQ